MLWTFFREHFRRLRPLTRPYTTVDAIEQGTVGPFKTYLPGPIHYYTHDGREITAHEFDILMEQWNRTHP